jgi:hypothetical protein
LLYRERAVSHINDGTEVDTLVHSHRIAVQVKLFPEEYAITSYFDVSGPERV